VLGVAPPPRTDAESGGADYRPATYALPVDGLPMRREGG
jgi:hypothetical protein